MLFFRSFVLFFILCLSKFAWALDFEKELNDWDIYPSAKDRSSFCQWADDSQTEVSGYRVQEKIRLASVTKIFTSFLAAKHWGPFHRFETEVRILPVGFEEFDVHVVGGEDPVFNYDKIFFLIAELNRVGVKKIRKLFFDSRVRSFLTFRDYANIWVESKVYDPVRGIDYVFGLVPPEHTLENLTLLMSTTTWSEKIRMRYSDFIEKVFRQNLDVAQDPELEVRSIEVVDQNERLVGEGLKVYSLKSAPLYRYLKDMNKYSINFLADQLLLISGGLPAMDELLQKDLKIDSQEYAIFTGSGLPDRRGEERKDNIANCQVTIRLMDAFAQYLNSFPVPQSEKLLLGHNKLRLSDVLLVVGYDPDGTFGLDEDYYEQNGAVVGKTGTLTENPAFNFAGYVSTQSGLQWFGLFLNSRWIKFRKHIVSQILAENQGPKPIGGYKQTLFNQFLSFDAKSYFTERLEEKEEIIQGLRM